MARRLALSVSQLNEYVRRLLQQDPLLCEVELRGEISNLKLHQTGTIFFTLKDEQAAISCVMYAQDALSMQFKPFDGMRAIVIGSVGLYTRGGQYQFYAREIKPQGMGVLFERYQMLKEQLTEEGLFHLKNKIPIPGFVDTVGVVSSATGAVIHDIMSVSLRRDPQIRILLCPVRVQGSEAADEAVGAIRLLDQLEHVSVIVVARGGGSMEDLWTFNEERVVRAVAACKKPIVSAVGHETDFTLCDFAADLRAPTPSAAAECVVPLREALCDHLVDMKKALKQSMSDALISHEMQLSLQKACLAAFQSERVVETQMQRLDGLLRSMRRTVSVEIKRQEGILDAKRRELYILNPYQVLERGYAMVSKHGKAMSSVHTSKVGDVLTIHLSDGCIDANVMEVKPTASLIEGE